MNKIDLKTLNWANAQIISKGAARTQLMRIPPMTFILYDQKAKKPLIAFESPSLAYFHDHNNEDIHEVFMVTQHVTHDCIARTLSEVHLTLADQTLVILTEFDRLFIAREQRTKVHELSSLNSPYKMWGIEPKAPYAFMLLTERLVDYIDDISEEGQQQQLVYVIWRDYELERRKDPESDARLVIDGEFIRFSAKRFNTVLVVFDLT
ncbi:MULTISPECIES: hypothetical protein [unclassified Lentimonas]|uniref:hypothetical protein n=1 Tax=unclassified Lentimonas TaxID=2630993 RepID=UPI001326618C|nr:MULTISPECIES: hypothetical protein [unclassified Lentimonas]CAA6679296.1 Unannotated [Lentimonas sp. CC4]CAA6686332.1 Unannotated [Lentimonas sp. CC6]CAA7076107.1 Unannotated [Lentimonas sp. CC4]CAA7170900.1 Unannotated [Lentimonas sp. CC21]CAA7181157.1 Unannotated [Lentimonas sp. CC8]